MTRKEVYAEINKYNLQEKIKKSFSKNYTNVSTNLLERFVSEYKNQCNKQQIEKPVLKKEITKIEATSKKLNSKSFNGNFEKAFLKLVEILKYSHILLPSEVNMLEDIISNEID